MNTSDLFNKKKYISKFKKIVKNIYDVNFQLEKMCSLG
jgi:hypothetical protein